MESARRAVPADLPDLELLLAHATAEVQLLRGGPLLVDSLASPLPMAESLARDLNDPDRLVVLGALHGVPLGVALARCAWFGSRRIGVIDTLYVVPEARQIGLGETMAELIVSWCRQLGCHGVDAPALPGSRHAKAFFEDNGFVARLLVMHRPLDPEHHG